MVVRKDTISFLLKKTQMYLFISLCLGFPVLIQAADFNIDVPPATTTEFTLVNQTFNAVNINPTIGFTGIAQITEFTNSSVNLVEIFQGTLQGGNESISDLTQAAVTTQIDTSGILDLNNNSTIITNLIGNGQLLTGDDSATELTLKSASFDGTITGSGRVLVDAGVGTVFLGQTNSYAGGTELRTGILQIGNTAALGAGPLDMDQGELLSTGPSGGLVNDLFLEENTLKIIAEQTGQVLTLTGDLNLNNGTLQFGDAIHAGTIVLGNTGVTAANNAKIVIANGTLEGVVDNNSLELLTAGAESTTINNVAVLNLNDSNATIRALLGSGHVNIGSEASTILTLEGGNFSGVIAGAGQLEIAGTAVTLSGDNTYSGGTTISSGILHSHNPNALGTGSLDILSKGQLDLDGISLTLSGLTGAGKIDLGNNDDTTLTLKGANFSGQIEGKGGLHIHSDGRVTLNGTNTFTGDTKIISGTLQIGNMKALSSGKVTLESGALDASVTGTFKNHLVLETNQEHTIEANTNTTFTLANKLELNTDKVNFGDTSHKGTVVLDTSGSSSFDDDIKLTVAGGTLEAGSENSFLSALTEQATHTTINSGAALDINHINTTIRDLLGSGEIITQINTNLTLKNADFEGNISGGGHLNADGGLVKLSGKNTYTGGTTVEKGTLELTGSGTLGKGSVFVQTHSLLDINTGDVTISDLLGDGTVDINGQLTLNNANFDGKIQGSGSLKIAGGDVVLDHVNTFGGGTTISSGVVQINNIQSLSSGTITFEGGELLSGVTGALDNHLLFDTNALKTIAVLSGQALTLKGDLIFNQGIVQFGDGTHNGEIILDNTSVAIAAGANTNLVVASGELKGGSHNSALGVLTKTAKTTTVEKDAELDTGDNEITVKKLLGGGEVRTSKTIRLENANFPGAIIGTGNLIVDGGLVILNGANTFTGGTVISKGTLELGSSSKVKAVLSSDVVIDAKGTLTGFGTIEADLANFGIIAPGANQDNALVTITETPQEPQDLGKPNKEVETVETVMVVNPSLAERHTPGTLSVLKDYTQHSHSLYIAHINGSGESDLIDIDGKADLKGGTLKVDTLGAGFRVMDPYLLLHAEGGRTGKFTTVDPFSTSMFLNNQVSYTANDVFFMVDYDANAFHHAAKTPNQIAVSQYILGNGATPSINDAISHTHTDEQFQLLMDELSGATYANQTLALGETARWFDNQMSYQIDALGVNCVLCAIQARDHGVWAVAEIDNIKIKSNEVSGLDINNTGLIVGAEGLVWGNTLLGGAIGYTHFSDAATERENANAKGNLTQLGLYLQQQINLWDFGASVAYGFTNNVDADRKIFNGSTRALLAQTNGSYNSNVFSSQLRAGYEVFASPDYQIKPFIGILQQSVHQDAFTETAGTGFELNVDSSTFNSIRSQLGIGFTGCIVHNIQPFVTVAWEHEFSDVADSITANFIDVGGSFSVDGMEIGRDAVLVNAGLNVEIIENLGIGVVYKGQFVNSLSENGGKVEVRYTF